MSDENTKDIYASISEAYDQVFSEEDGGAGEDSSSLREPEADPNPRPARKEQPEAADSTSAKADSSEAQADSSGVSEPEIAAHHSLTAEEAAAFKAMPKEAQRLMDGFVRRRDLALQRYTTKVQRESQQKLQEAIGPYQGIGEILQPHMQRLRLKGSDLAKELDSQLAWSQEIDQNPLNAIAQLCLRTKVSPRQVYDYLNGAGSALQDGQDSESSMSDAAAARIAELEDKIERLSSGFQQNEVQALKAQVDTIANLADANGNKVYPYFEDVRQEMGPIVGRLHRENPQMPLHQAFDIAYRKTVWGHDGIRDLILQQMQQNRAVAVADKKRAATSLPANGSGVKSSKSAHPSTIEESILQAAEQLGVDFDAM